MNEIEAAFAAVGAGLEVDYLEAIRQARAPLEAAYDAAYAEWGRLMDAPGGPDWRAGYAVLNVHYPWILDRGFVGCMRCGTAWPCVPFAELYEREMS